MLGLFAFASCEKDADKIMVAENPAPAALAALPAFTGFNLDNAANELTFSWSASDFGFKSSTTYTLQVDSANKNFAKPVTILSTSELTGKISVGNFNKLLLAAGYETFDINHSMEMRVIATIHADVKTVVSATSSFVVAPYAVEFPPIYMCGAATGGWDWTKGVEVRSSAPKVYTTIAYFIKGETFRFFAQANWDPTSYNYPYFTTVDSKFSNANDGDKNFKVEAASGYYEIVCDLKTKSVSMTSVPTPKMFMTGAAVGGWNWTTDYVTMTWKSNGIFEATTDFIKGETFRFFAQADWGPTSYNYPYFTKVDALFENANDGDKNLRFIGTTGNFKIKLNMLDKIVTMTPAK